MIRNRITISNRGKSYSKELLLEAVNDVRSGLYTVTKASTKYNIPRITLNGHISGHRGVKSTTYGRSTTLNELKIADNLRIMEKYCFGLSRKEVLDLVGEYVNSNKLNTPNTLNSRIGFK